MVKEYNFVTTNFEKVTCDASMEGLTNMETLFQVAPGILADILIRLTTKDLGRCRCVTKIWNGTIHNAYFVKSHMERSIQTNHERTIVLYKNMIYDEPTKFMSVDFPNNDKVGKELVHIHQPFGIDHTDIVGYCNGLVCIQNKKYGELALWNPSIRKYKMVPFSPIDQPFNMHDSKALYTFGYNSFTDDHHLVRIVKFTNGSVTYSSQVQMYSLRRNAWTQIQNLSRKDLTIRCESEETCLNNYLHWLVSVGDKSKFQILTLNLVSYTYSEFPTPIEVGIVFGETVCVLGGFLCACVSYFSRNDVWIMKDYGEPSSWTKLYSIEEGALTREFLVCTPLVLANNGERVFVEQDYKRLYWYDASRKKAFRVQIGGLPRSFHSIVVVKNLYLLDCDTVIDRGNH